MYLFSECGLNKAKFNADFADCSDFLLREVTVNGKNAFFCAMDGLINSLQLNECVIEPLLRCKLTFESDEEHLEKIKRMSAGSMEMNEADTFEDCYYFLMSGFAVLVLDGVKNALSFGVQGWNRRNTDEPTNEAMVKGAKECFVESINDNKALLRKRLKTSDFKLRQMKIGKSAPVPAAIAYIKGRADDDMVDDLERRIKAAPLDAAQDFGSVEAFIEGKPGSVFSTVGNTERPDVLASKLLEGRVGILIDGTPFSMYTPYLFTDNFSSLDDYNNPAFYSTFVRLLKIFSFFISLFLPALYVAVGSFHQELIPTTLLYIIASSEDTTPFSLAVEAVLIHILYEIMREAGLRLPKTIGHAVSIIGAIVIGEAMVTAGLISEPMLVVVTLTAISSYVVYPLYERAAVLRLVFILIAGITGLYGLTLALCVMCANICALSSYGVPYSAPVSPLTASALEDTVFHSGWKCLAGRRVRLSLLEGYDDEYKN